MHKLNLLPKEILKARKNKKLKIIGVFLLLIVSVFFYPWLNFQIMKTNEEIERIMNKSHMPALQSVENIDAYLEKQQVILNTYKHIEQNNCNWPELINKIISIIPKKTVLNSISIDEGGQLKLKGVSPKTNYIGMLLSYLEQIKDITKLNLDFINYDNLLYIYEVSALIKIR